MPKDTEGCRRMPKDAATEFEHAGRKPGLQSIVALSVPCQTRSDTPLAPKTGPRRAQEGSKSGFNFFFPALGAPRAEKRGVQEGLETGKVERRRRRRHDHVEKGRQRSKKAAQVRPRAPQGAHQTLRIVGFARAKRIFFILLLNFIFTPAGR